MPLCACVSFVFQQDLKKKPKKEAKIVRDDFEEEDDQESYFKYVESLPQTGEDEEDLLVEYDEDGNPIVPEKSKIIDPLPPIDHSLVGSHIWLLVSRYLPPSAQGWGSRGEMSISFACTVDPAQPVPRNPVHVQYSENCWE